MSQRRNERIKLFFNWSAICVSNKAVTETYCWSEHVSRVCVWDACISPFCIKWGQLKSDTLTSLWHYCEVRFGSVAQRHRDWENVFMVLWLLLNVKGALIHRYLLNHFRKNCVWWSKIFVFFKIFIDFLCLQCRTVNRVGNSERGHVDAHEWHVGK